MKKLAILIISLYQIFLSPLLNQIIGIRKICRFSPSCSEYTKISIEKYGLIKGIKMGLTRLLHCHPFNHNYANI